MTQIQKNLLPIGQGFNIRTFIENGVHINRKPLTEIEQFGLANIQANKEYVWDFSMLNKDFIPYTLFAFKSTGVANNDNLVICIRNASNNATIWELNLAGKKIILGNAFYYDFPFVVVSKTHTASIVSSTSLDNLLILGETTYLNPLIPPTY